jgi:hypothetical protein
MLSPNSIKPRWMGCIMVIIKLHTASPLAAPNAKAQNTTIKYDYKYYLFFGFLVKRKTISVASKTSSLGVESFRLADTCAKSTQEHQQQQRQ